MLEPGFNFPVLGEHAYHDGKRHREQYRRNVRNYGRPMM